MLGLLAAISHRNQIDLKSAEAARAAARVAA
jgi:hypothetical protein